MQFNCQLWYTKLRMNAFICKEKACSSFYPFSHGHTDNGVFTLDDLSIASGTQIKIGPRKTTDAKQHLDTYDDTLEIVRTKSFIASIERNSQQMARTTHSRIVRRNHSVRRRDACQDARSRKCRSWNNRLRRQNDVDARLSTRRSRLSHGEPQSPS